MLSNSETKRLGADSMSFTVAFLLFYLAAAVLSMLTVLTHIAQIINLPFELYYRTGLGICVAVTISWFIIFKIQTKRISIHDTENLFFSD